MIFFFGWCLSYTSNLFQRKCVFFVFCELGFLYIFFFLECFFLVWIFGGFWCSICLFIMFCCAVRD